MLDVEVNKLLSIFFGYIFVLASFNKLDDICLAKNLVVDSEWSLKNVLQRSLILVVEDVLETFCDLWLPEFKILYTWMLS